MEFKENNKAIFLQIADAIADRIIAGELPEGQRIESVRAYAAQVAVNANTVMRAYEYLASENIIFNKRGIGFFVNEGARQAIMRHRRSEYLSGELNEMFRQLTLLGINPDQLKQMYIDYKKQTEQ